MALRPPHFPPHFRTSARMMENGSCTWAQLVWMGTSWPRHTRFYLGLMSFRKLLMDVDTPPAIIFHLSGPAGLFGSSATSWLSSTAPSFCREGDGAVQRLRAFYTALFNPARERWDGGKNPPESAGFRQSMSQFLSSCCFLFRLKIWQKKMVSSVLVLCVTNFYQRANCGRFRRLISSSHFAHSKLGHRDNCVVRAAQVGTWWGSSSLPEIEDWRYWMVSHRRVRFLIWTHWKVQYKLTWLSTSKSMEEKSDHRTVPTVTHSFYDLQRD